MSNNYNPMDNFLPKLDAMVAFWIFGVILAAIGGALVWFTGAPDHFTAKDQSDYITSAGGFIALWVVYAAAVAVCIGVFKSEGGSVKGRDGAGSTKLKQGVIWAGILLGLASVFTVVYTVLSIKHWPG